MSELPPPPSSVNEWKTRNFGSALKGVVVPFQWISWFNLIYRKLRGPLWEDELTSLTAGKTPAANAPAWTAFGPSGVNYQWAFGVNDHIQTAGFHVTHRVKPGSKIYPHIHWTTDGIDTNTVKWEISYTIAKGHNQEAFPADSTLQLEQAGSGTAWQHMIVEATDAQALDVPQVDSLIIADVKRITNGGTDNADTVFCLFIDYHFEMDRFGTPQKAPDFYAY